jgi:branched-subunit amino acid aminotransferase/4-amino-4-deoxychorismate lyase
MELSLITKDNYFSAMAQESRPWQEDYLCMYSTLLKGVTKDPDLMMIPIDDHLVHRGDGVFDVMRCVRGKIYQMEEHIKRLETSAGAISLDLPPDYFRIRDTIADLVLLGGEKECLIRVVISRGPGSFGTNPLDCPISHLYIVVVRYHELPEDCYREGVSLITSSVPIKKSFFASIKSCNYLPNVLMKLEAVNAGCKFSVGLDEEGFLAEGSTENIGVLTEDGILKFPGFERTLSGTTAKRIFHLAHELVRDREIREVTFTTILPEEAYKAKEVFLTGTSLNVLPVTSFDGHRIGQGSPGPLYSRLSSLIWKDMTENRALLTEIDWES